jgi:hypothetical protein
MSEYIEDKENTEQNWISKQYEKFFWMTAKDVTKIIYGEDDTNRILNSDVFESENVLKLQEEHQKILENCRLKIYESPKFEQEKYFEANPKNSIEIDTYITNPNSRDYGLARELVFEGIKSHMEKVKKIKDIDEVFLCSTLHRDNLSSKYVSEFFGLKDSLFVNRRKSRDREVHITKIKKQDIDQYLKEIQEKLTVLYGYKKEDISVSTDRKKKIINEQLQYEKEEFRRLNRVRHSSSTYKGIIKNMKSKSKKIEILKENLAQLNKEEINFEGR